MPSIDTNPPSAASPPRWLWFARVARAFAAREWASVTRYRMAFIGRAASFLGSALGLVFMSRFVAGSGNRMLDAYGGGYLGFALVGFLAAGLQYVGLSALAGRVRTAQMTGVLEAEMATPAPTWMVLGVVPIYETIAAVARGAIYLGAAVLLLDLPLRLSSPLTIAATVFATIVAMAGLGLISAGLTMLTRRGNPIAALLGAASFLLSGVMFPVAVLPGWMQTLGRALPLTHALESLRQVLLLGAPFSAVSGAFFALCGFALVLGPVGLGLFAWALARAKIDGSLTHY